MRLFTRDRREARRGGGGGFLRLLFLCAVLLSAPLSNADNPKPSEASRGGEAGVSSSANGIQRAPEEPPQRQSGPAASPFFASSRPLFEVFKTVQALQTELSPLASALEDAKNALASQLRGHFAPAPAQDASTIGEAAQSPLSVPTVDLLLPLAYLPAAHECLTPCRAAVELEGRLAEAEARAANVVRALGSGGLSIAREETGALQASAESSSSDSEARQRPSASASASAGASSDHQRRVLQRRVRLAVAALQQRLGVLRSELRGLFRWTDKCGASAFDALRADLALVREEAAALLVKGVRFSGDAAALLEKVRISLQRRVMRAPIEEALRRTEFLLEKEFLPALSSLSRRYRGLHEARRRLVPQIEDAQTAVVLLSGAVKALGEDDDAQQQQQQPHPPQQLDEELFASEGAVCRVAVAASQRRLSFFLLVAGTSSATIPSFGKELLEAAQTQQRELLARLVRLSGELRQVASLRENSATAAAVASPSPNRVSSGAGAAAAKRASLSQLREARRRSRALQRMLAEAAAKASSAADHVADALVLGLEALGAEAPPPAALQAAAEDAGEEDAVGNEGSDARRAVSAEELAKALETSAEAALEKAARLREAARRCGDSQEAATALSGGDAPSGEGGLVEEGQDEEEGLEEAASNAEGVAAASAEKGDGGFLAKDVKAPLDFAEDDKGSEKREDAAGQTHLVKASVGCAGGGSIREALHAAAQSYKTLERRVAVAVQKSLELKAEPLSRLVEEARASEENRAQREGALRQRLLALEGLVREALKVALSGVVFRQDATSSPSQQHHHHHHLQLKSKASAEETREAAAKP